ncbi:hypothetical protein AAMO2058_001066400 [Amorphochlora amoebiformis]
MGCSSSDLEKLRDADIQRENLKVVQESKLVNRILILGASECGKSTILKQMKILNTKGHTRKERMFHRMTIRLNTVTALQQLITAAFDLKLSKDVTFQKFHREVLHLTPKAATHISPDAVRAMRELWLNSKTIAESLENSTRFYLLDSAQYFLDRIREIFDDEYLPPDDDILHARATTRGIIEIEFSVDNSKFRMFDVGGQRGERKKWISFFDDVHAILFVASLSEYDQMLLEDNKTNRMRESVGLFAGIINLPYFVDTSVLLFLNKDDIFKKKIHKSPLENHFPEYENDGDEESAFKFILHMYLQCNQSTMKSIYWHRTTATDTDHIAVVWQTCKSIVLRQNLQVTGLLDA